MNLPNAFTISRFILIPVYVAVYFSEGLPGREYWALGVILLAGITDIVDGYLARLNQQVTELGVVLDPLADKLMMIAIFLSLLVSGKMSLWQAGAVLFRDLAMILGSLIFHFKGKKTLPANILGKLTTVLFYCALVLALLNVPWAYYFLWFVIALSYLASLVYVIQIRKNPREQISDSIKVIKMNEKSGGGPLC